MDELTETSTCKGIKRMHVRDFFLKWFESLLKNKASSFLKQLKVNP